jgi:glycosyltransferase involved in cell wall biosynthesis
MQVPFATGGAEWHADALIRELRRRGFRSELVQLPFRWDPREEVVRSALAWRLLDLERCGSVAVDLFIGTRFPSYAVRHPLKVVWLFHQFRQAYDLHDAGIDGFEDTPRGRALRDHLIELDTLALKECRRIFTTSQNNARRLRDYNGLEAEVLRLPLLDPERRKTGESRGYVLSVGRLDPLKRTDLLLRSLAVAPGVPAVIVGDGPERATLEKLSTSLGIDGRVRFAGRVSDSDLLELYAGAAAVYYAPWDEDYGLVTLEAFHAHKPVLTTTDAGGPLEFVTDGETGLVTAPQPEAIAASLLRLREHPELTRRLGEAGWDRVRHFSWDEVIERLTQDLAAH